MKQLYEIYEGYENIRKGDKKLFGKAKTANRDAYQAAMKKFRDLYEEDITRVCGEAAAADDPAAYLADYGRRCMDEAERILSRGKTAVARAVKYDSTFFTVMYVIPLIRLCEPENRDELAEAVRAAWAERFSCPEIRLSTYQEIHAAFNTRFLGIL